MKPSSVIATAKSLTVVSIVAIAGLPLQTMALLFAGANVTSGYLFAIGTVIIVAAMTLAACACVLIPSFNRFATASPWAPGLVLTFLMLMLVATAFANTLDSWPLVASLFVIGASLLALVKFVGSSTPSFSRTKAFH